MNEVERQPIRLGVDLGSVSCRVAYVYPDEGRELVPVPLTLDQFRPCFPITETLGDPLAARFFPSIKQRLDPAFDINLFGQKQGACQILASLLAQAVAGAERFAGRAVEGILVGYPIWAGVDVQTNFRWAVGQTGIRVAAVRSEAEAACTFYRDTDMADGGHASVLLVSAGFTGLGVAAVRITPRWVRVLAEAGHQGILGGNVIDLAIMNALFHQLEEAGVQVADVRNPQVWSAFQYSVEKAKEAVKEGPGEELSVPLPLTPALSAPVRARVDGGVLRRLVSETMVHALRVVDQVLDEASLTEEDLQTVLLLGGTTHLPDVTRALRERFPGSAIRHLAPEAVAGGAAHLALDLEPEPTAAQGQPVADSAWFMPKLVVVPGLVSLVDLPPAEPPVPAPDQAVAEVDPKGPEVETSPVESLTLAELRQALAAGRRDEVVRDLRRLRDAVFDELRKLEE